MQTGSVERKAEQARLLFENGEPVIDLRERESGEVYYAELQSPRPSNTLEENLEVLRSLRQVVPMRRLRAIDGGTL